MNVLLIASIAMLAVVGLGVVISVLLCLSDRKPKKTKCGDYVIINHKTINEAYWLDVYRTAENARRTPVRKGGTT